MGAMAAIAIASGVIATASGLVNISGKYSEKDRLREQYEYQLKLINGDPEKGIIGSKQYLLMNYENSMSKLQLDKDSSVRNLNASINNADSMQQYSINQSSRSLKNSLDAGYAELSMMLASASQNEGTAMQNASMTGFRNTGSNMNQYNEAQRQNDYYITQYKGSIANNALETFASAVNTYGSYESEKESYKNSIIDVLNQFQNISKSYKLQYDQNLEGIKANEKQLEYAIKKNSYEWYNPVLDGLLALVAGGLSTATSAYTANIQETSYSIQQEQLTTYKTANKNYESMLDSHTIGGLS